MNKITLQIIDSPKRDLEWRLLLAFKLLKKKVPTYLGSAQNVRVKFLHKGGVLIGRLGGTSGRSDFDKLFLHEVQKINGRIFYFHDEGGAFRVNGYDRECRLAYPSDLFIKEVFEKVYFWGEAQNEIFKNEEWINKTKVIGCPRFDLYQDVKKSPTLTNINDKYILINTRFSNVQTVKDDPSSLSKRMLEIRIEGGELESKSKSEIISEMFFRWRTSARDFVEFIEMISKVCLMYPKEQFLLRPHPAEDVEWYRENFSLIENLTIDNSGDVKDVFSNTKLLIHSECTTGLEADLQGIPSINYIPFPDDKGEGVVGLRSIGEICFDVPSIINKINLFLDGDLNHEDGRQREIDYYISNLRNLGEATNQVAEDVNLYYMNNSVQYKTNYLNFYKASAINHVRNLYKLIKFKGAAKKNMWPSKVEILNKWIELGGKKEEIKIGNNYIETKVQ